MVGAGVTVADLPAYAAHNDLGTAALLAAMSDARRRRLVLASSMVVYGEGRYACAEHGAAAAGAAPVAALEAGDFENHCPTCGRPLGWELVDEDARLDPRSSYAASKVAQEHYTSAWARQADGARDRAEVPQRLRARDAAGHAVLRRRRDLPLLAGARRGAAGLRGRRPDARLRARRRRRPGQPASPSTPSARREPARWRRTTSARARPVSILDVAGLLAGPRAARARRSPGEYRPGDVRHVVASPARATAELGFTAAITPEQGLAGVRHRAAARLRSVTSR